MTLRELIASAGIETALLDPEAEISGLAYRSADVERGHLFFCVPGFSADGHDFAPDAVKRGASALVCERPLGLGIPEVVVGSVRAAMAPLSAAFYGHPTRSLDVVGITGTNGKTTTAFLVRDLLEAAGRPTGLLGTVHSVVGGQVEQVERTTPEAVDLQCTFRRMLDAGDVACAMEVSSHALELHRADAIAFDCAVFTNLTRDHLDFHETLDAYFDAKRRLFATGSPRASVVNVDDERGRMLAEELRRADTTLFTFGIGHEADYRARSVRSGAAGSTFACSTPAGELELKISLPGVFNVYNALAAFAAACAVGVDAATAAAALATAGRVPGRFEPIEEGQPFGVLVDYAHTPDSLANVLRAARELLEEADAGGRPGGRLFCVFGAGGDRDRDKRPLMGEAARTLADHVVVTSDNPRSEAPGAIISAIVDGATAVASARSELEVEPDRRKAIARALGLAQPGDLVVIAGKGHEQGQELADGRKVPFDDREVAREELRGLRAEQAATNA
jgi:UDP-N-acetylmuramoyl-L-alanyl-D-glutamate--2,6-diaminopimelate ligase